MTKNVFYVLIGKRSKPRLWTEIQIAAVIQLINF